MSEFMNDETRDELILMRYEMAEVDPSLADVELDSPIKVYMYALAKVALTGLSVSFVVEHEGQEETIVVENLGKTSTGEGAAISVSAKSGNQEVSEMWGSIAEVLYKNMFGDAEKTTGEE